MVKNGRWTKDEDARLRELAPSGLGRAEIGKRFGRSALSIRKRASKLKVAVRYSRDFHGQVDLTPAEVDQVRLRWAGLIGPMKVRLREAIEAGT